MHSGSSVWFNLHETGNSHYSAAPLCICSEPDPEAAAEHIALVQRKAEVQRHEQPPTPPPQACSPYLVESAETNSCPSGHTNIGSESICQQAALTLGYPYNRAETSDTYPAGCYLHAGASVWFNRHATGGAIAGSAPICALRPKPYMEDKGANACTGSGQRITTEEGCLNAAIKKAIPFKRAENKGNYPAGCYVHSSNGIWFNHHATGTSQLTSAPLCMCGVETPTPTSAPTPVPTDPPTEMPTASPSPSPTGLPTQRPTDAPTPIPVGPYVVEDYTDACKKGSYSISAEAECRAVAASLQLVWQATEDTPTYPAGCYRHGSTNVYFNARAAGNSRTNAYLVCVWGATASPTTLEPTLSPTESPTEEPTEAPTESPTEAPTDSPTDEPAASQ